ncbi:MAG: phage Gp37/Gp68 family protein [Phycisphaerae bacterium]|nr:phage Gp37/Gp68 family protein [Phycisphaerae bacterium]
MAQHSRIEWTESTWNPVTGCTKISAGCQNCYAERMARRLHAMGVENYRNGFEVTLHPHVLSKPLSWKQPQTIFVNSMSDLFHESVPDDFILQVFDVMRSASWHRFQVLTKRSERLLHLNRLIDWPENVWMGTTVENAGCIYRIEHLRNTEAVIKFLSLEPLLGPLHDMNLKNIDWVIAGGESGPGARPIEPEWARDIRDQCVETKTPFFFKQWGGTNKKKNGRELDKQTWNQMPKVNRRSTVVGSGCS